MAIYKLVSNGVRYNENGLVMTIPKSHNNRDWIKFQKWEAKGNTPDPADPPSAPTNRDVRDIPANTNSVPALKAEVQGLIDKLKELGVIS